MRKLLAGAVVLILLIAAFSAGRFTSPAPLFRPGELAGDAALEQAWEDFLRSQHEALSLLRNSEFFEDDLERAEAYRGVLYNLVGAIKTGVLMNPEQPRFMRAVDWSSKSGLDNPDNNYYLALLRDDSSYRVRGSRGSTANLVFQLLVGQPGVKGAGSSTNVSVLYDSDIQTDAQGNFEIIVSRDDPGPDVNWMPSGDGAETLLVRFTHSDWDSEAVGNLQIERIGFEGTPSSPLTPMGMARSLEDASASLFDRTATWLQLSQRLWQMMPRNGISEARPSQGGLVGQYSAFGSWELDNNQALVISTAPSAASYQGIALGNPWFVSLDYESRTTSLSLDQLQCSGDGRCYAVISHRDPGVANWLDTEGHRRGLIMMRWQGLAEALPEEQQPRAQLVDFAALRDALPGDTPEFSPEQRLQQRRQRRASVQARFDG